MAILWKYTSCKQYDKVADFCEDNPTDSFNFKVKIADQTGYHGTKFVEITIPLNTSAILRKLLKCL